MNASQRYVTRLVSPQLYRLIRIEATTRQPFRNASTGRYSTPNTAAADGFSLSGERPDCSGAIGPDKRTDRMQHLTLRQQIMEEQQRKAYHMARMRFAGIGLLVTFAGLTALLWNLDLEQMENNAGSSCSTGQRLDAEETANQTFQGKDVHVVGLGSDKRIVAQGQGVEVDLVETGTSSVPHFPRTIDLPSTVPPTAVIPNSAPENVSPNAGDTSNLEQYTLVGLGIRTVLFIQVYVVGMYVRTQDINALQEKLIHSVNPMASTLVPSEKDTLRKKLLDPIESRELWTSLLQVPGLKTAWRITPTRNTDFGHLRDGFVNGINARTQEARRLAPDQNTEFDSEEFGRAVQDLKSVFTGGKALKGSILILARNELGNLNVLYQPKLESNSARREIESLGSISDERVSRLIWLGYLAGDKVSSKAAREGVVDGCITFAARPIGSVESRVI